MCFSNLPIEFDEEGDPYLVDEAEEVGRPDTETPDDERCRMAAEDDLMTDPESAYEAIVASLPDGTRERLEGRRRTPHRDASANSAESD